MFGYITPLKSELKVKEFEYFRSYYCGLCNEIKNKFGNIPRFCLNYDLTFIGFLLDGLFSNQIFIKQVRCIKHANKKILILTDTNALDYCANLSILLFDYKLKDNIEDDKSLKSKFFKLILSPSTKKSIVKLNSIANKISNNLILISNLEKTKSFSSLDEISHPFSEIMGCVLSNFPYPFEYDNKTLRESLYYLGYFIGKWIYLIDALDDLQDDTNTNNFNPYLTLFNNKNLNIESFLSSYIDEIDFYISNCIINCSDILKTIPFKKHFSIIDNVINLGMLNKYYEVLKKYPFLNAKNTNTSSN